jgi:hypothetical protein
MRAGFWNAFLRKRRFQRMAVSDAAVEDACAAAIDIGIHEPNDGKSSSHGISCCPLEVTVAAKWNAATMAVASPQHLILASNPRIWRQLCSIILSNLFHLSGTAEEILSSERACFASRNHRQKCCFGLTSMAKIRTNTQQAKGTNIRTQSGRARWMWVVDAVSVLREPGGHHE